MQTSTSYTGRDRQSIWHPFTPLEGVEDPLTIISGEGPFLVTDDGRKILDAVSSWWVNLHGHSHPEMVKAISQQAAQLEHVIFAGFTHPPAIELAEALLNVLPANQSKIFYSDNGSTAVEVAVKMAMQYWYNRDEKRNRIIALDGAYHGDTFGAMSVGERSVFTTPFQPYLFDVDFLNFPSPENEERLLAEFGDMVSCGDVAAFLFEPLVQGAAGMRMYSPAFLDRLISLAHENDVLCIADEVMTGFGRTGTLFASDQLKEKADIFCLSKGLTGGAMALGATSCAARVMEGFRSTDLKKAFLHGHSFTANPIACAAALASMKLLLSPACRQDILRISARHREFVERHKADPVVREIRSLGTILALEVNTEGSTSYLSEMRNALYPFFLRRNILLRPLGNLIYILPPYIITDRQLDTIYQAIEEFLQEVVPSV